MRSLKTECNEDCGDLAQEVSEGSKINNLARGHSYDILTNDMPTLCP